MESRTIVAPYITAWSAEQRPLPQLVVHDGSRIGYEDEIAADRDRHGVLWHWMRSCPGQGRPEFGRVHTLRQRRAMARLLCQVCAGPADQDENGVLWLLKDHRDDWPGWPETMAVTEPPVCVPCAHAAIRLCPALRKGAVAVRVRQSPIVGVRGMLYRGLGAYPVAVGETIISFEDPAVRWVRATNLLRELHDCDIVPLAEAGLSRVRD